MNGKIVSFNEFLIYRKSKVKKAMEDKKRRIFSIAVFREDDLNLIKKIRKK